MFALPAALLLVALPACASLDDLDTCACGDECACGDDCTCEDQPVDTAKAEWVKLFNGKNLKGWVSGGDADAWTVKGGEIVTAKPGHGWWLRTDKMYRDFELELDFWMPKDGNSGLGLRGSSGGDPAFTGIEVQMLDTFGQEPDVHNCGAVYEAIAPATMAVKPAGEWNTYRVRLVGDTLDVWLNGEHIHDAQKLDDRGYFRKPEQKMPLNARATTGYIALQDHGHAFRYRNIRIKDLSPDPEPAGMTPLITTMAGNTPAGWFARDDATWTIEDGALVGRDGPGHLFTIDDTYTDMEIRSLVKVSDHGNSGIYFRVEPRADMPWPNGYEAQVDQHDPKNYTGCVYNMCWPQSAPGKDGPITRDEAWFDYRIVVKGNHIQTWINGVPMADCERDDFASGRIAVRGTTRAA
ncbi:MAG: DUF1080 domain-containing protein [Phycisphaerales bacterium]